MELFIPLASALFGILAALAWAMSAIEQVPTPSAGWGGPVSSDDPFIKAFNRSALCNRWGAGFAALSAFLGALSTLV
jgi:hypothetical protein